jgi:hypothetical protein
MAAPRRPRFAYYDRLSAEDKRAYRRSDAVGEVPLHDVSAMRPLVPPLVDALESGDVLLVQRATGRLTRAILADLDVGPLDLEVLEARPRGDYGELHGLYTYEPGQLPRIQVWMRTAAKGRIVAWRTYLRTLLHEIGHHLDLHYFDFHETLHTQGFYRRENHLFHQLVVDEPEPKERAPKPSPSPPPEKKKSRKGQLDFPGF